MLRALLLLAFLLIPIPALAAMECDTTTEVQIQKAIQDEPSRLVRVLKNQDLADFLSKMTDRGYLVGQINGVDAIYIVDAGKLAGYTEDNVWLFFVEDGCLIKAIPASKNVVLEMLQW